MANVSLDRGTDTTAALELGFDKAPHQE